MFNGIIRINARVLKVADHPRGRRLTLAAPCPDHRHGESTAINGVCLTVAELTEGQLQYDIIHETLEKTNLGGLVAGDLVHMERSMRVGDPIDGHFVQGHVDGSGELFEQIDSPQEVRLKIRAPEHLAKYLTPKGSIAIDGVSLTLASVNGREFEVALIPTTLELTTLGRHQPGYRFNLECDTLAKTIISYLERLGK